LHPPPPLVILAGFMQRMTTTMLWNWIPAGAKASMAAAALLLTLPAAAGHDPVDPALRRFTGKVTGLGQANKAGRVATLRFDPLGPGMVAPKRNELRGWRITFIKGKLFGQTLWVKDNSPTELTVRDKDPSLAGVVEGDILMIEQLDPKAQATSRRKDDDPRRLV
jgi:hypothetical protein